MRDMHVSVNLVDMFWTISMLSFDLNIDLDSHPKKILA